MLVAVQNGITRFCGLVSAVGFAGLLLLPAFAERRHRGLARRLVAVRRRAVLMMPKGERTQPRRALRRCHRLHDPTNHGAVGKHVEVVAVPLAGWAAQIA